MPRDARPVSTLEVGDDVMLSAMPTNAGRFYRKVSSLRAIQALKGHPEDADF